MQAVCNFYSNMGEKRKGFSEVSTKKRCATIPQNHREIGGELFSFRNDEEIKSLAEERRELR